MSKRIWAHYGIRKQTHQQRIEKETNTKTNQSAKLLLTHTHAWFEQVGADLAKTLQLRLQPHRYIAWPIKKRRKRIYRKSNKQANLGKNCEPTNRCKQKTNMKKLSNDWQTNLNKRIWDRSLRERICETIKAWSAQPQTRKNMGMWMGRKQKPGNYEQLLTNLNKRLWARIMCQRIWANKSEQTMSTEPRMCSIWLRPLHNACVLNHSIRRRQVLNLYIPLILFV
jgi:hypothetical protein